MKTIINVVGIVALSIVGCKTPQVLPSDYEDAMIVFGSGGGFSGVERSFTLLENGALFSSNMLENSHLLLGEIDENLCNQIFKNYHMLELDKIDINNPGNTYKYLMYQNDGQSHRIVWEKTNNNNLSTFFKILSKEAQSNTDK